MSSTSAILVGNLIADGDDVRCARLKIPTFRTKYRSCNRLLLSHGAIRCERCGTKHGLTDLMVARVQGREGDLYQLLRAVEQRFFTERAEEGKQARIRFGDVGTSTSWPCDIPKWLQGNIEICHTLQLLPLFLPETGNWFLVGSSHYSKALLSAMKMSPEVTINELPHVFQLIRELMPFEGFRAQLPTAELWRSIEISRRCYLGMPLDTTVNWDSTRTEWIEKDGINCQLVGGSVVLTETRNRQAHWTILISRPDVR